MAEGEVREMHVIAAQTQVLGNNVKTSKRRATFSSDLHGLSESIKEVRKMVRETTELVAKFKEAVTRPPVYPAKKPKLSSYV